MSRRFFEKALTLGASSLLVALVTACSGGSGGTAFTPVTPGAAAVPAAQPTSLALVAPAGSATAAMTIVIPRSGQQAATRHATFISPSTKSVSISVTPGTSAPIVTNFNLTSTSPNCTSSTSALTCTIAVAIPAGSATFAVYLFDQTNATGNIIAQSTVTQTINSATTNTVPINLSANNVSVAFAVTPNSVQGPSAQTATLTAVAKDIDGNAITGTANYTAPIVVTNNDTTSAITMSGTTFKSPADAITITYNGTAATTSTTFTSASVPTVTPVTLAIPPPHGSIFVIDNLGILVFAPGANGNVAPVRAIAGANTLVNAPHGIALDAAGNMYSANYGNGTITVYAPDANGNVAPIRTIAGAATGMVSGTATPWGIAIDGSGNVFAELGNSSTFTGGSMVEYAAGANGNVAPIAQIAGTIAGNDDANDVSFDPAGRIRIASTTSNSAPAALLTYSAGSNGNVAPIFDITGSATHLTNTILFQQAYANGNVYVAAEAPTNVIPTGGAVFGWPLTTTGNVAPTYQLSGSLTTISGGARGIVFDPAGNLYVLNITGNNPATSALLVFAPGAVGNVAPIRTIAGTNTLLTTARFIAISP